jgi:hypothetical protein
MKRPILRFFVLLFAACSIGAKDCASAPTGLSGTTIYCHTDPPVGCAAYCSAKDTVTFLPACLAVGANTRELEFELKVRQLANDAASQGVHFCPEEDLTKFLTPCALGIEPVEWPNQSHEVCTPVPPGCPL